MSKVDFRGAVFFVALTFALSYSLEIFLLPGGALEIFRYSFATLFFLPTVSLYITGRHKAVFITSPRAKHLALAFALPTASLVGSVGLAILAGIATPLDFAVMGGRFFAVAGSPEASISALVLTLPLLMAPFAMFEEAGWRWYLLRELSKSEKPAILAVVSGLLWGLVRAPIIYSETGALGILAFVATSLVVSLYLSWLVVRGGGLLSASLAAAGFWTYVVIWFFVAPSVEGLLVYLAVSSVLMLPFGLDALRKLRGFGEQVLALQAMLS